MDKMILVVDDDNLVNEFINETLSRLGYTVYSASSGAEALEMMEEYDFDLVLTDWRMGEMGGLELAESIQGISPDTRILLMTGSDMSDFDGKAKSLLAGWIKKPFTLPHILNTVEQVIGQRGE